LEAKILGWYVWGWLPKLGKPLGRFPQGEFVRSFEIFHQAITLLDFCFRLEAKNSLVENRLYGRKNLRSSDVTVSHFKISD
jgi:hypothetical protein